MYTCISAIKKQTGEQKVYVRTLVKDQKCKSKYINI